MSRGGARARRRSLDSNMRSSSGQMARGQGIGGTTPRGGDIVTARDMLEVELLNIRYAMALRLDAISNALYRQAFGLRARPRSTSSPDRRSPVSSRTPTGPPTVPAVTPRSPVSSSDNPKGEPPL